MIFSMVMGSWSGNFTESQIFYYYIILEYDGLLMCSSKETTSDTEAAMVEVAVVHCHIL